MSVVTRQLDGLRDRLPGCVLAAYGDVSAQLVLRSSADAPWPQEKLDDLCKSGARQFALADRLAPHRDTDQPRTAVVATRKDVRVYVGGGQASSDLLCCVCSAGTATDPVVEAVQALMAEFMEQEK